MKILTKEQEAEHYNATVKGGLFGGLMGLGIGTAGVMAASRRYPGFRSLTVPFRVFLAVSAGTFSTIIAADRASRGFEQARNPDRDYTDQSLSLEQQYEASKPFSERAKDWGEKNRYSIVFGSWVASMGIALGIVQRNPYLSGQQKLVQARVYAQGLTVAVLLASFMLETNDKTQGKGRWETIKVLDPNDPTHKHYIEQRIHHERYAGEDQWKDMVEAEERKMKEREAAVREQEAKDEKAGKKVNKKSIEELEKPAKGVHAP
ncbi:hypothetical protein EG327_003457 [Venturia inaequalis]|uniref:HIG1 domain-containing protein n=1 Tax=Venturia inaequalis TaxID=5025 RepID=A0A8H3U3N4_VENIN|nr:hypothetical protein EG327_003457 [Venturia inaequalis]